MLDYVIWAVPFTLSVVFCKDFHNGSQLIPLRRPALYNTALLSAALCIGNSMVRSDIWH